jgi:hypothetical protein
MRRYYGENYDEYKSNLLIQRAVKEARELVKEKLDEYYSEE